MATHARHPAKSNNSEGNPFSAYRSVDGTSWTLVGQETLALASTLQVGLAVTSHDNAQLGSGTFDNVKIP